MVDNLTAAEIESAEKLFADTFTNSVTELVKLGPVIEQLTSEAIDVRQLLKTARESAKNSATIRQMEDLEASYETAVATLMNGIEAISALLRRMMAGEHQETLANIKRRLTSIDRANKDDLVLSLFNAKFHATTSRHMSWFPVLISLAAIIKDLDSAQATILGRDKWAGLKEMVKPSLVEIASLAAPGLGFLVDLGKVSQSPDSKRLGKVSKTVASIDQLNEFAEIMASTKPKVENMMGHLRLAIRTEDGLEQELAHADKLSSSDVDHQPGVET